MRILSRNGYETEDDKLLMISYWKGACITEKWKTKLYDEKPAWLSLHVHFKQ
uniref:Uncharacterized protein n=1 Tax=Moniliophthora roreri TaxID=221103 RepID=A0A0W0F898_MONRR